MKKKHFTSACGVFALLLLFTLSACHDDTEPLYEGYGLVNKHNSSAYSITLDDGNILYPRESFINPEKLKDSTRLYVLFNIMEETDTCTYVRINNVDTILTKQIIPYAESILDSVGNSPVKITKHWFAHGFLNFEFLYAGRYNLQLFPEHAHMVNLLQCASNGSKLIFEFRHNDFGDSRDKVYVGVVSFPIGKLVKDIEKPIKMDVKFNDSENTSRTIELIYK